MLHSYLSGGCKLYNTPGETSGLNALFWKTALCAWHRRLRRWKGLLEMCHQTGTTLSRQQCEVLLPLHEKIGVRIEGYTGYYPEATYTPWGALHSICTVCGDIIMSPAHHSCCSWRYRKFNSCRKHRHEEYQAKYILCCMLCMHVIIHFYLEDDTVWVVF